MKKVYKLIFICIALISCEKVLMKKDPINDAVTNFESMWKTVDERYSFFSYKKIDWESVKDKYYSKVYNGMPDSELFEVLADMLFELRDGHVNLVSHFDVSRNWEWEQNSPHNFDYDVLQDNYLGTDYEITGPLINTIIDDSVGYIYYGSFLSTITSKNINHVLNKFKDLQGVIIDIRDNGGGNTLNGDLLASRFADKKREVLKTYYKNGPNHDDFYNDPVVEYIEPTGNIQFTKKVIVLTNRKSYSASTFFTQQIKAFPHVTIVGDTCGGGGGLPIYSELPNGWRYRFSSTITTSPNGFNIEHGIPPDIQIDMDPADELNGIDSILEKAIELIKS